MWVRRYLHRMPLLIALSVLILAIIPAAYGVAPAHAACCTISSPTAPPGGVVSIYGYGVGSVGSGNTQYALISGLPGTTGNTLVPLDVSYNFLTQPFQVTVPSTAAVGTVYGINIYSTVYVNDQYQAAAPLGSLTLTVSSSTTGATLTVSPTQVPLSASTQYVTVSGTGFTPNVSVTVTESWAGGSASYPQANGLGSFSVVMPIVGNLAASGGYTISAADASGHAASTNIGVGTAPVSSTISLNPTSVSTSSTSSANVVVSGQGFASSGTAYITAPFTGVTSSATEFYGGTFTGSIVVPANTAAGTYTVRAYDLSGHSATADLLVTGVAGTTISVSPTELPQSASVQYVTIIGSGFTPGAIVTVAELWSSGVMSYPHADGQGTISVQVPIQGGLAASSGYTISAADSYGHLASTSVGVGMSMSVQAGWNLIALPFVPDASVHASAVLSAVLAATEGGYAELGSYSKGTWKDFWYDDSTDQLGSGGSTDFTLQMGVGYALFSDKSGTLDLVSGLGTS